jgi:hypothetical protein
MGKFFKKFPYINIKLSRGKFQCEASRGKFQYEASRRKFQYEASRGSSNMKLLGEVQW